MEYSYKLRLIKVINKEPVIVWLRSELSISKSKAEGLIELAPSILAGDLPLVTAERYAEQLRNLGAIVEVEKGQIVDESVPQLERKKPKRLNPIVFGVLSFLVIMIILLIMTHTSNTESSEETKWETLLGNTYEGVKVYAGAGEQKAYMFTVLGGNEKCFDGRRLFVLYPSGNAEWKMRDAIVQNEYLFVMSDDPALETMQWREYPCP